MHQINRIGWILRASHREVCCALPICVALRARRLECNYIVIGCIYVRFSAGEIDLIVIKIIFVLYSDDIKS